MDERTRRSLKDWKENRNEESMMEYQTVVSVLADAYAAEHSTEPLTPERAVEMGGTRCDHYDWVYWSVNGTSIDVTRVHTDPELWGVQIGGMSVKPIRTVGDLRRLLDCLGWESGQEGGEQ